MNKLFEEVVEKVKNGTKFWYSIEYSGRQIADFYLKNAVIYFRENAIVIEDERGNCGEILYKEGIDLKESSDLDGHVKFDFLYKEGIHISFTVQDIYHINADIS